MLGGFAFGYGYGYGLVVYRLMRHEKSFRMWG
jgi:hypothetical protein